MRRWCAWDSNPGRQDDRCRQIHWAMAAPLYLTSLFREMKINIVECCWIFRTSLTTLWTSWRGSRAWSRSRSTCSPIASGSSRSGVRDPFSEEIQEIWAIDLSFVAHLYGDGYEEELILCMLFDVITWIKIILFKNGLNTASFCLFSFFSKCKDKYSTNLTINDRNEDGVLWAWTQGGRIEGADEYTALRGFHLKSFFNLQSRYLWEVSIW